MTATGATLPSDGVHDLDWIKSALQTAMDLECATLPLYLSSMFSLEVQNYTAYNQIRSVAMEEMVHMAIAGNMLAALGGRPSVAGFATRYPTVGLPGGVEPDLRVGLAPLSGLQLERFMRLEMPATLLREVVDETYPTIAAFYGAIGDAIQGNAAAVRSAVAAGGSANQVGDDIGFTTISATSGTDVIEQLLSGVEEILHQGEGSSATSIFAGDESENELSHYGKFAELYYGAQYLEPVPAPPLSQSTVPEFFRGRTISWPVVINTLSVPSDGYERILAVDPGASEVRPHLAQFDTGFSSVLSLLDQVWNGPAAQSWPTLGAAVKAMVDLRVLSCFMIMRYEVPAAVVAQLPELYPDEITEMQALTDLSKPVFYGPRFHNSNPRS